MEKKWSYLISITGVLVMTLLGPLTATEPLAAWMLYGLGAVMFVGGGAHIVFTPDQHP